MTVKRKRHRKHGKRRHVPGMRAKRHGTGTQCRNTLESDTAQAKPIVTDGRKACQGKPRDTRLSRPCPQSQDWECGGLRHDRIISVRRQRMKGKISLALPLVDAGNIVSQIGDATASCVAMSSTEASTVPCRFPKPLTRWVSYYC